MSMLCTPSVCFRRVQLPILESIRGYIPRSLLHNKLTEAGANPSLLAAGKLIAAQRDVPFMGNCTKLLRGSLARFLLCDRLL